MTLTIARDRSPRVRPTKPTTPSQNRCNAAWLRDQHAALRQRIKFGPGMLTLVDVIAASEAIDRGEDFRTVLP